MAAESPRAVRDLVPHNSALCLQIKDFVTQMLVDLSHGKLPSVSISKYQIRSCFSKGSRLTVYEKSESQEKLGLQHNCSARRLVIMLRVLGIVQQLLEQDKHASKRDIYYTDPAIFHDVKTIDQAINDICIQFHCNRSSLHVVSVSKGLVMGWLSYDEDGRRIDCMKYSCTGFSIPAHTNQVQNIKSRAGFILVVEKETVFQRLANDGYCVKNQCIILSGKGYPDVATRRSGEANSVSCRIYCATNRHKILSCSFLRLLKDKLGLPVFALVDGDPHGLDILLTYTFGSLNMAYDAEALVTPHVHWLGVLLSDCEVFEIPRNCLLPLSMRGNKIL